MYLQLKRSFQALK